MKTAIRLTILMVIAGILFIACSNNQDETTATDDLEKSPIPQFKYTGTASIKQGLANTTTANLYPAGQRIAALGNIIDSDQTVWTVPADVNYTDDSFPFAPDLYNPDGTKHFSAAAALEAFDDANIVEIDANGEVITGYIFADNYFELYVNGAKVGKDAIPFTQFNSSIVKFKVSTPYTIAMLLVDWEEGLGIGTEVNLGSAYHAGDGGMVAVFKDASENIVATTGTEWKAQTFYTAPLKNLACASENGTTRSTADCNTDSSDYGSDLYALHWETPANWMSVDFDDSDWPAATTHADEIVVIAANDKPSYTNFTDVFDDATNDAEFIWSTNLILDNEVIVRYTVE